MFEFCFLSCVGMFYFWCAIVSVTLFDLNSSNENGAVKCARESERHYSEHLLS